MELSHSAPSSRKPRVSVCLWTNGADGRPKGHLLINRCGIPTQCDPIRPQRRNPPPNTNDAKDPSGERRTILTEPAHRVIH